MEATESRGELLLEVIACSVADAVAAEQGGAGRLEVVSDLARGGLTPPLELVQQIISIVSIPVRVMLRDSTSYKVANQDEMNRLRDAAREFSQIGVNGLVVGFLGSGRIDLELTQELLDCAPDLKATFHHAFEEVAATEAIQEIKKLRQVDRILSHGGRGAWSNRIERLATYQQEAKPEIEIIAGGGLDPEKIAMITSTTQIREFHVGRAARAGESVEGGVEAHRVKRLVSNCRGGTLWPPVFARQE